LWQKYFERALTLAPPSAPAHAKKRASPSRARAYEAFMKHGAPPHGERLWPEFVLEAYAGHASDVVLLEGVPDVAASRPHSHERSEPQGIALTATPEQIDCLPKLSETLLEFGEPLWGTAFPRDTQLDELRKMMTLVELCWNAPVYLAHGQGSFAEQLRRDIEMRWPQLPPELRTVLDVLFERRRTDYAYDPRLSAASVEPDGRGGFTVLAESRLLLANEKVPARRARARNALAK